MDRIERVKNILVKENADLFMVTDPKNILYLTGFEGGKLFITQNDKPLLTVSALSFEEAEDNAQGVRVQQVPINESMKNFSLKILSTLKPSTILYDSLPVSEYLSLETSGFKLRDGSNRISHLRRGKDVEEIECIRKAAELTEELMEILMEYVKPGIRENDLAKEADIFIRERGLEYAFPMIIVSGFKSSNPHGKPSLKIISEGEPVTIDLGLKYGEYCVDMTRSFVVGRNPEYETILKDVTSAQERAMDYVKADAQCRDIDKTARDFLNSRGYDGLFIHSLGHGVGLDIHEPPSLNPLSEDILMENEVVTIEPGIYIKKKFGCRVEDTILVLKNGCKVLTSHR
ncbi:aminopeptidase P family protein [Candidatus Bathyarchaeota archaeon]|nr:aminopeptidase P family protein [Candidatus Bathyarchaeota archaeon]